MLHVMLILFCEVRICSILLKKPQRKLSAFRIILWPKLIDELNIVWMKFDDISYSFVGRSNTDNYLLRHSGTID